VTPRARNRALRNRRLIAAGAVYALANLIGFATLRWPDQRTVNAIGGYGILAIIALGVALTILLIAAALPAARARGYAGRLGLAIALAALALTGAAVAGLLYENANQPLSVYNPPRVYDNRLPLVPWAAVALAALAIRTLPLRPDTPAEATEP
jgi:hypothetical protein